MTYPFTLVDDEGPAYPLDDMDTITDLPPPGCRDTVLPPAPITIVPTGDDE